MKDRLLLLALAAVAAALAWAFWHFGGTDAFGVMSLVALVVVIGDNIRLRRQLRKQSTAEK